MTETPPSAERRPRPLTDGLRDLRALRRTPDERLVAGVCGGVAQHFDIDPVIVRVVIAALVLFGGAGAMLYVALWLTVPQRGHADSIVSARTGGNAEQVQTAGLLVGGLLAATTFLGTAGWYSPQPIPGLVVVVVAAVGLFFIWRRSVGGSSTPPRDSRPTPSQAGGDTGYALEPTSTQDVTDADTPAPYPPPPYEPPIVPPAHDELPPPPEPAREPTSRPKKPRSHLFAITVCIVAIAEGIVAIVDGLADAAVPLSLYPGVALAVIALGLLVGTWWGRSRGLIVIGAVASVLTLTGSLVGPRAFGDYVYTPTTAAGVHDSYLLGAGRLDLHLENVRDPSALDGRTLSAYNRIGKVRIVIPTSLDATVHADVDIGNVRGPVNVEPEGNGGEQATMTPAPSPDPDVTINVHVLIGEIEIARVQCPGTTADPRDGVSTIVYAGGADAPACH